MDPLPHRVSDDCVSKEKQPQDAYHSFQRICITMDLIGSMNTKVQECIVSFIKMVVIGHLDTLLRSNILCKTF